MKKMIKNAVSPWKTRYTLHWLSPDGRDCLLGGSNNLDEIISNGFEQVKELLENPWETDERRLLFLQNMNIIDEQTKEPMKDPRVYDFEDYVDGTMSELDSRINYNKNITSKTFMPTKRLQSQLSFDFVHDGYYTYDDIERIVDIALDTCDCVLTGLDIHSVDYSDYPEYKDYSVSQCSADFEWDGRKGYSAKVIKEVLDEELSAIGYELVGIDFVSLEEEVR